MKVTLILPQPPGYSETFFRSKIQGLQKNGYGVILVTAATEAKFESCLHLQHPKIHQNPLVQLLKMLVVFLTLLPYLSVVLKYIKLERVEGTGLKRSFEKVYINATLLKLKTDWLHFGFATMALDRELVAKAIGAKSAVSFRGFDIGVYPLKHRGCYNKLWKHIDKVHSISNYLLNEAYKLGLSRQIPFNIITPAVDLSKFKALEKYQSNKVSILTIARLHWIKGIDDLIETASILKQQGIDFEWKIIGEGDRKAEERFKFHVYQKGLESEVLFLGRQNHDEVFSALNSCSIYVQTSLNEGFCNAVLEAQAMGKLVLGYNSGALSENILDGKTGFLSPNGEPKLLAKQILEVIQLDENSKKRIQEKAIKRVHNQFTLEQQQEAFVEFYKEM